MDTITAVALVEPPVIAINSHDEITLWRFDDGSVVLRIGQPPLASADTILIERHQLTSVWTTLKALDEEMGE